MDLSNLLILTRNIGIVLFSIVFFGVGGLLVGAVGMFIGFTLLRQYGLGIPIESSVGGLAEFFWAFAVAAIFGILGGILGLVLGIKWVRKHK